MKKIFLACANSVHNPLQNLVEEIKDLEREFRHLSEQGRYDLMPIRHADLEDIFYTFNRYPQQIEVFHYAGHANQHELLLEGGGRILGLSTLIGQTQGTSLRLAFLNGCATLGLVDYLHEAGVAVVIATSREVNDATARHFAKCFYETWTKEGKTLRQAFDNATAFVKTKPEGEGLDIQIAARSIGLSPNQSDQPSPWRLWLNERLNESEREDILNWPINPPVRFTPQVLGTVGKVVSESLRAVAYDFVAEDAHAQQIVEQRGHSELTALISRMPWVIGTHIRRLFALDESQTMTRSGLPRLREVAAAYTELTRFLCYSALSALWDDSRQRPEKVRLPSISCIFSENPTTLPDYIYHLRRYHTHLLELPGDPILLEEKIGGFLALVDGDLQAPYQFMERLHVALAQPDSALPSFVSTYGPSSGLDEVCLRAEAFFAQFVRASFFLTQYELYSVRSISVDKVRYVNLDTPPFVHKTVSLHAAFSEPKPKPTKRKAPGDNYSILLAPRVAEGKDPLENVLNLSPFYVDKYALIADKRDNHPAIFVLKQQPASAPGKSGSEYTYEYLDSDVNHDYLSPDDHQMKIARHGLGHADGAALGHEDNQRFSDIHKQIELLRHHFKDTV